MGGVEFNSKAFGKMILHSVKFPHCAVNGLLLSERSNKKLVFVNSVPLFHISLGLSPMYEIAFQKVQSYCEDNDLVISGYYHANEHFSDLCCSNICRQICEKIEHNCGSAHLVMLDCQRAVGCESGASCDDETVPVLAYKFNDEETGGGLSVDLTKQTNTETVAGFSGVPVSPRVHPEERGISLNDLCSCLMDCVSLADRKLPSLVDFDIHLDDIATDPLNPLLDKYIINTCV